LCKSLDLRKQATTKGAEKHKDSGWVAADWAAGRKLEELTG